jgi:hypothetical protein
MFSRHADRLVVLGCALWLIAGCAHTQRGAAPSTLKVGAPVTVAASVSIKALAATPESFAGQAVRLEGTVSKVCQGMGCWVEVKAPDGATFIARSLDESVLLPTDCAGRRIVVQGVVTALPSQSASEPNPEGHECPRPNYLVATQGIELY